MPSAGNPTKKTSSAKPRGASEIAPGVYVGGWTDALQFAGARFCVLDDAPVEMPRAAHVQIYSEKVDRAGRSALDHLAESIRKARERGKPVLVFCGHGVRRSPLAGAWYLRRATGNSLDAAYDRIRSVRPKIEHAREWVGNAGELAKA